MIVDNAQKLNNQNSRSFVKILKCLIGFIFAVFLVVGLVLPAVISSEWGLQKSLGLVNSEISGKLRITNISLSWLGTQKIQGLQLMDHNGQIVLAFQELKTKTPLYQLLLNPYRPGSIRIDDLKFQYVELLAGLSNIEQALSKKSEIKYPARTTPIQINGLNLDLNILEKFISFAAQPVRSQYQTVNELNVYGTLQGINLSDLMQIKTKEQAILELEQNKDLQFSANINTLHIDVKNLILFLKTGKWEENTFSFF